MQPLILRALSGAAILLAVIWFVWFEGTFEAAITALLGVAGALSAERLTPGVAPGPNAGSDGGPSTPDRRSIAVLPFDDLAQDAVISELADGVHEDIIARLARLPDLKVIARVSSAKSARGGRDLQAIGRELGVGKVLQGSLRAADEQVKVSVRLVDASTGEHLWADAYDRGLDDIRGITEEIAQSVAEALHASLPTTGTTARPAEPDPQAYRHHLLGRHHANSWSPQGWDRAREHLQRAMDIDDTYAAPHATLAYSLAIRAYAGALPPREAFGQAQRQARLALDLDESETQAHMALGLVHYFWHRNWSDARSHLERAIEISPGNSVAMTFLGSLLDTLRQHDEAMRFRSSAYELDPLDPLTTTNLAYGHLIGRRFADAIDAFERSLELDRANVAAIWGLGTAQVHAGDPKAAVRTFEGALSEVDAGSTMLGFLGWAEAEAGQPEEARTILEDLLSNADSRPVDPYHVALVFLGLGELDRVFEWLDRAFEVGSVWLVWIHITPEWDAIQSDERFQRVVDRLRLPAPAPAKAPSA